MDLLDFSFIKYLLVVIKRLSQQVIVLYIYFDYFHNRTNFDKVTIFSLTCYQWMHFSETF